MHAGICAVGLALVLSLAPFALCKCTVSQLEHQSLGDRRDLFSWVANPDCENVIERYQITAEHKRYKSCEDSHQRDENSSASLFMTNTTSILLTSLHPFSQYVITVRADVKESALASQAVVPLHKEVDTFASRPETTPLMAATSPKSFGSTVLIFSWASPPVEECTRQNGEMDGYWLELWGLDPWVQRDQPLKSVGKSLVPTQEYLSNLKPFTRYKLNVFTKNKLPPALNHNPDRPLELIAQTKPTKPDPPTAIKLSPMSTSVHISWQPTYPPKGPVSYYTIHYGINGTSVNIPIHWLNDTRVAANQSCIHGQKDRLRGPVCSVITGLSPNTLYVFELRTFNKGIDEGSEYSEAVMVRTDPANNSHPSPPTTPSTSTRNSSDGDGSPLEPGDEGLNKSGKETSPIVIVLILVAIIIVLIVVCTALIYKIQMRKLKLRYEQNFNANATNSTYLPSNTSVTTSYVQSWANQIQDIQSRRLPEPPPDVVRTNSRADLPPTSQSKCSEPKTGDCVGRDFSRQESTTDLGGYLKPTFVSEIVPEHSSTPKRGSSSSPKAIPAESYESPLGPLGDFQVPDTSLDSSFVYNLSEMPSRAQQQPLMQTKKSIEL